MKALIQRVSQAAVTVDGDTVGAIDQGLLVLLGVERGDDQAMADRLLDRLLRYRVFSDADGKMNLSVSDIEGGLLLVSQFTLAADTRKGLRPGFSGAAEPALAESLYNYMLDQLRTRLARVSSGCFGANMQVSLINDGPVTFLLE
ncbi:D-aminoacyl-tRNA deacylase [Simiduia agarivorans]|uniref:D-aminoacyl-tRNA deacylase n=1 Tax=Simiduia agarivorans (strain DSM 21679 / JCM 13881 / BCRC 17597 / SA1) TaxID=1117647 RepID=K4KLZ1_SIMAS|nr:D-aminoacyl-tRNA deacylase [Simiduia agarivorans]AFV00057.1 D-tyrosyl-tRNA deacylase [Simiduia agarivorans SA1 = DSM 21679]